MRLNPCTYMAIIRERDFKSLEIYWIGQCNLRLTLGIL